MNATRLQNGNLLIPLRAETGDVVGDGLVEVAPGDPRYQEWDDYLRNPPTTEELRRLMLDSPSEPNT